MNNDLLPTRPKTNIAKSTVTDLPVKQAPIDLDQAETPAKKSAPKKTRRSPVVWWKALSKKKRLGLIILVVLILGGGGAGAYFGLLKPKPTPKPAVVVTPPVVVPVKTTEPSKLTGVEVKKELNNRPVTAIMIENSPDARPQSGLKDAGVIFEAIAEGGITRFLTLHQEDQPDYIGPVRSVRPYYLDWLQGFDAPVAHAGGSPDGLAKIKSDGVKDLDQFANAGAYMRVNNRYAPHNLYTTMAKLDALNASKGYTSSNFTGFPRKAGAAAATATAKTIDFSISGYLYNAHYDYDTASNSYKRSEGGKPHVDERSGAQLAPTVVIAIVTNYNSNYNGVNGMYQSIGSGHCYVFQDGIVTEGTWAKSDRKSQITFKDANGADIKLDAGQTWISVVAAASAVTFKP